MLEALRQTSPETARKLLHKATGYFLPDPITGEVGNPLTDPEVAPLVEELAKKLHVDAFSLNDRGRARILKSLSDEYTKVLSSGMRPEAVKRRLGTKGLLQLTQYEVQITDPLRRDLRSRGLSQDKVESCVRSPTAFQHLFPSEEMNGAPAITIFAKLVPGKDKGYRAWLVVIADRKESKLLVSDARLVFSDDVGFDYDMETPLELFRAFCDKFGAKMNVGRFRDRTFVLYEVIPARQGESVLLLSGNDIPAGDFTSTLLVKKNDERGVVEVAVAYFINEVLYRSSLDRHGVRHAGK